MGDSEARKELRAIRNDLADLMRGTGTVANDGDLCILANAIRSLASCVENLVRKFETRELD